MCTEGIKWVRVFIQKEGKGIPFPSEEMLKEFSPFIGEGPQTIYLAISFLEPDKHLSLDEKRLDPFRPVFEGKKMTFSSEGCSLWTTSKNVARKRRTMFGFLIKVEVQPKDIVIETNRCFWSCAGFVEQHHIIIRPGTYSGTMTCLSEAMTKATTSPK